MSESIFEGRVKVKKMRFPRNPEEHQAGDFGIIIAEVVEVSKGEVKNNGGKGKIIIKGILPTIKFNEEYKFNGNLFLDGKWGWQYEGNLIRQVKLDTDEDKRKFLSKILTEDKLQKLYMTYKQPFDLIEDKDIEGLCKVNGIGKSTAEKIIKEFESTIDLSAYYVQLYDLSLTKNMINKLIDRYGSADVVVHKIKNNPYIIADEVNGIGWKKADEYAMQMGVGRKDPLRIKAFVTYYLKQRAMDGDSWIKPLELMEGMWANLGDDIEASDTRDIINEMYEEKTVIWDDEKTFIALNGFYHLEKAIANDLIRLLNSETNDNLVNPNWKQVVENMEQEQGWDFTEEQIQGIDTLINNQVVAITGFSGTGKTTVVKAMLEAFPDADVSLCALAGRAAARLAEVTGVQGYTIHKLLGYSRNGFAMNSANQLSSDIVILDETSMVGGQLFYRLVQAIKNGSKLLLVGDDGQLESIGACNVFRDILDSGIIPSVRLTKIHRQAQKSAIITDSIKIRNGKTIFNKSFEGEEIRGELKDLKLNIFKEKELLPYAVLDDFKAQMKVYNDILDVQVITPTKTRGDASVHEINRLIQDWYNPSKVGTNEITLYKGYKGEYTLRPNDKVINRKNMKVDVKKDSEFDFLEDDDAKLTTQIWNGDIGIVQKVINSGAYIEFGQHGLVFVNKKDLRNVKLGYAITVHSSQGSQFKSVIVSIDYSAYALLSRELIYTAITRASKYCVLAGEGKAINHAIGISKVPIKQTFLHKFLSDLQNKENDSFIDFSSIFLEDDIEDEEN